MNTENMLADIATRRGATLEEINQNSTWIKHLEWMKHKQDEFPTQTVGNIILTNSELQEVKKESPLLKVKLEGVGDRDTDNTTYTSNCKSLYALEELTFFNVPYRSKYVVL